MISPVYVHNLTSVALSFGALLLQSLLYVSSLITGHEAPVSTSICNSSLCTSVFTLIGLDLFPDVHVHVNIFAITLLYQLMCLSSFLFLDSAAANSNNVSFLFAVVPLRIFEFTLTCFM